MANKFKDELDEEFEKQKKKPTMTYEEAKAYELQDWRKRRDWDKKCRDILERVRNGEKVPEYEEYRDKAFWENPYHYDLPYTQEEIDKLNEAHRVIREEEERKKIFP